MSLEAGLYLIPTQLSDVTLDRVLPAHNIAVVRQIRHFVVESVRSARRFLKKCDRDIDIDALTFNELNEHTDLSDTAAIETMLTPSAVASLWVSSVTQDAPPSPIQAPTSSPSPNARDTRCFRWWGHPASS